MTGRESERAVLRSLRDLAREYRSLEPGPLVERAVMAAFDAAWAPPQSAPRDVHAGALRARKRRWTSALAVAAAAMVAITGTVTWSILRRPMPSVRMAPAPLVGATLPEGAAPSMAASASARPVRARPRRATASSRPLRPSEFVPWPGAGTLPSLESGELVRLDLPVSVLPSLGLALPTSRDAAVRADVIIGQDGFARAVRLVQY
jgi:hypothetical protein